VRNNRNASVRLEQSRDDDAGGWLGAPLSFLRNIGWGARDTIAFAVGVTGSVAILVNALFLQSGPHPAPLFKASSAPVAASEATNTVAVAVPRARPPEPVPTKLDVPAAPAPAAARPPSIVKSSLEAPKTEGPKTAVASATPQAAAPAAGTGRNDAIADMLSASRRVTALQRALAQYGYGQLKPTGIVDADTRAAIEKFERERKLPVTGQASDRVVKELAGLTGRPLD
jgi:Putative peptidoglycan binding domain